MPDFFSELDSRITTQAPFFMPGNPPWIRLIRLMKPYRTYRRKVAKKAAAKPPINCRASARLPRSASDPSEAANIEHYPLAKNKPCGETPEKAEEVVIYKSRN